MSTNDDYTTVLVDPEHINVMIWAGLWLREAQHNEPLAWPVLDEFGRPHHLAVLDNATADAAGQMLLDTNARAVNNEQGRDQLYVYSYTPLPQLASHRDSARHRLLHLPRRCTR